MIMETELSRIKSTLQRIIDAEANSEGEKWTMFLDSGTWSIDCGSEGVADFLTEENAFFIVAAKTYSAPMAKALLDEIAFLEDLRICSCERPAKILPDGGVMAPGDHTEDCIMWIRNFQLQSIISSFPKE